MKRVRLLVVASAVLLVNSAYLAALAEPSLFYFANVALHVGLGIAVAVAAVRYLMAARPPLPPVLRSASVALGAGASPGVVLTPSGATRPYRWVFFLPTGRPAPGTPLM